MSIVQRFLIVAGLLLCILFLSGCDLEPGINAVLEPVFSPLPGVYEQSCLISLNTDTEGAIIRYTLDGSVPSMTYGIVYSEPFQVTETTVIRAISYKKGFTISDVSEGLFTITKAVVSTPTFSIAAGAFQGRQLVEIESTADDAIIRYTLDGSDPSPTTGIIYNMPVNLYQSCTLKAIAYKEGLESSSIQAADYVITLIIGSIGPGGGYVFFDKGAYNRDIGTYDLNTGDWTKVGESLILWRYLEAAPSSTEGAGNNWGGTGISVTADLHSLGGGWMNTFNIISEFGATDPYQNRSDYAARHCSLTFVQYNSHILNDWYLPSLAELKLLYSVLYQQGLGDFVDDKYWSSTSVNDTTGYLFNFMQGSQSMKDRYEYHRVRAIRAF